MKKLLVLSLFLILMIGTALNAQVLITIGDGTSSNGTTSPPTPYGTYYKNFRQQYLYTAAEIENAGGGAGPINSLAFNVSNVNTCSPMPNFTIKIKTTSQTSLSGAFEEGEYTQVFYQNNFTPVNGWNTHTFDTPFMWDGSSNILIDIVTTLIPGSYTQNASVFYTPTTGVNTSLRYQSDSSDAGSYTGTATTGSANRANIMFNMTAIVITDPPSPAQLVSPADGSTLTGLDVSLNWTSGGGLPTGYDLYYGTTNPPPFVGDLGLVTSYTPAEWDFNTTYFWQVVPYNDEGDALDCPVWSFTTVDDPTIYADDLPFLENFDMVTPPVFPAGWTSIVNSTSTYALVETRTTGTPYSAPNHAYLYNSSDTSAELILVSPPIDVPLNTLRLKFMGKGESSLNVFVGTYASGVFTSFETVAVPANYNQYMVSFASYSGPDNRIAFKLDTSTTYRDLYLDDIVLEVPAPEPPEVASIGFPYDEMTTFLDPMLSWIPSATGEPATSFKVYMNDSGVFGPADLIYEGPESQYQTSGLSNARTYYWKVEPVNVHGTNTTGDVWTFNTPGESQLAESFDDTSFPPLGWTNVSNAFSRSTTTPFYGAASAYEYIGSAGSLLYTPLVYIEPGTSLDFWARAGVTTGIGRIQVQYSEDGSAWTPVGETIAFPTNSSWNYYSVNLGEVPTGNYFLGLNVYSSTTSSTSFYIDHVFGPDFASIAPDAATLSAPTDAATDVSIAPTLSWDGAATGGIPTGFRVYLDETPTPTTMIADTPNTSFSLTENLEYNTTYYWNVVAYNGAGDAEASATWSFTTMQDPTIYEIPWLEDFSTWPAPNWTQLSGLYPTPTGTTTQWYQDDWLNITTPVNKAAKINIYGTGRYGWLVTPPIAIPADGYELLFDLGLTDYGNGNPIEDPSGQLDDKFIVAISDSPNMSNPTILREWNNSGSEYVYNQIPNIGTLVTIPLTGMTGTKFIAFYGESTVIGGDNDLFVDNVMVREIPAGAPDPVTLQMPADGSIELPLEGFDLTWSPALTGGAPLEYAVFMSQSMETLYSDLYWLNLTTTSFNPVVDGGVTFSFGETWYWTVMATNETDSSIVEPPFSFTIMQDPRILSLPYTQNFDFVTAPALPAGWTGFVNSSSTSSYVNTTSSTTYAASLPNTAKMYNYNDTGADLRLITSQILVPMNTIKLSFSARGNTGYTLEIGTVDDPGPAGVFTPWDVVSLTSSHAVYSTSFASYNGTDQYIAFRHGLGGTYRSIYIDDILMEELMPVDLAATAINGPGMISAGNSLELSVNVYNNGTATQNNYTVQLHSVETRALLASLDVNEALAPGEDADHTLAWTPTVAGTYEVYGKVLVAGDGNDTNDMTMPKPILVFAETAFLPMVGDPNTSTSVNNIPFNFFYKNNVAETIYMAHEMQMSSGTINAIFYGNDFVSDVTVPIKIWMKNTTATVNDAWLPFDDYTLVFDGSIHFPSGVNTIIIPLQTPFMYTGGNLAVRTNRVLDTVYYSSSDKFWYTADPNYPDRTRYYQSDTITIDPADPGLANAGTQSDNIPNTAFLADPAVPITDMDMPEAQIASDGGNMMLTWTADPYAYCYLIYASDDPYAWTGEPAVSYTNSMMIPASGAGFYKVVAQSYHHEDRTIIEIANPAVIIGENHQFHSESQTIPHYDNKD